jgi:serine/threonine protein kinase
MGISAGQLIARRYRVDAPLGQGGMAEVYLATDLTTAQPVALKILHSELAKDEDLVYGFMREAQTLYTLHHPNIVRFLDVGHEGQIVYLCMEHIPGINLRQRLNSTPIKSWRDWLPIARQLTDALQYAHLRGIVHSDVKPANILLTPQGDALLSDFGISRMFGRATFIPGDSQGTPGYMSR